MESNLLPSSQFTQRNYFVFIPFILVSVLAIGIFVYPDFVLLLLTRPQDYFSDKSTIFIILFLLMIAHHSVMLYFAVQPYEKWNKYRIYIALPGILTGIPQVLILYSATDTAESWPMFYGIALLAVNAICCVSLQFIYHGTSNDQN